MESLILPNFLTLLPNCYFCEKDCALNYDIFLKICSFPKFLSHWATHEVTRTFTLQ